MSEKNESIRDWNQRLGWQKEGDDEAIIDYTKKAKKPGCLSVIILFIADAVAMGVGTLLI